MSEVKLKRVTVQVDPELFDELNRVVRHGFRGHLLERLLRMVLDSIERDGDIMLGALIAGEFKLVRDKREAA